MPKRRFGHDIGRGRKRESFEESIARIFHLSDDDDAPEVPQFTQALKDERAILRTKRRGRPKLRGNAQHRHVIRMEAIRDRLEGAEMLAVLVPRKLKEKLKWAAHYHATTMRALTVKAIRHYLAKHIELPSVDKG